MTYIVHGAAGAQGRPLKERLIAAGHEVWAPQAGEASLRFESVEALTAAYREADGVFVHLPMGPEPVRVQYAHHIVAAVEAARPRRVIVSTSGTIVDRPGTAPQAPDDSAIRILIRGIEDSGVSHAVAATRLYLENLLLPMVFEPVASEGRLRYPIPADFPVSWSSHRDVAAVVERLLTDHAVTGLVGVGHLPGLRGTDLADGFAAHLRRPVAFEALTPEQFGDLLAPMFGPGAAAVVSLYRALARESGNVIDERTSAQRLLGIAPRSVDAWLAESAA